MGLVLVLFQAVFQHSLVYFLYICWKLCVLLLQRFLYVWSCIFKTLLPINITFFYLLHQILYFLTNLLQSWILIFSCFITFMMLIIGSYYCLLYIVCCSFYFLSNSFSSTSNLIGTFGSYSLNRLSKILCCLSFDMVCWSLSFWSSSWMICWHFLLDFIIDQKNWKKYLNRKSKLLKKR